MSSYRKKVNEVESHDRLLTELAALNKKIDGLSVNSVNSNLTPSLVPSFSPCTMCGGFDHLIIIVWLSQMRGILNKLMP
jgi:hypothetical protein